VLHFEKAELPIEVPSDLAARLSLGKDPTTRSLGWNLQRGRDARARLAEARQAYADALADLAARSLAASEAGPSGSLAGGADAELRSLATQIKHERDMVLETDTELHRRLGNSFAALAAVMMAMPIGLLFGRGGAIKGGLLGVMIPALLYYPAFTVVKNLAESGQAHSLIMWLPTVVIAIVGAWMLQRIFMTT
jgi:hypothetical protein